MSAPLVTTARIQAEREVFTLINTFHVHSKDQDALIDELASVTEHTMKDLRGFLGASVHRSVDGHTVVNYVQWETRQHFEAMFANVDATAHLARVKTLAISIAPVFFTVAYVGAKRVSGG